MKEKREDRAPEEDVLDGPETAGEEEVLAGEGLAPEEREEGEEKESEAGVLRNELAMLEDQLQDMRDRYVRAVADLDNARKRARQAIGDARRQAAAGVLLELVALVDDFERALETMRPGAGASQEMLAAYEGVELIYRRLMTLLERRGVKVIEAVGQPFDPGKHEAVAQIPATDEQKDGTVALEMAKGYMYGSEVLRHSRVGVAVHEREK